MVVTMTERLIIRQFELSDIDFIIRLLNDEGFIQYIGDKNVRNRLDAENYLKKGPLLSYQIYGYGLYLVALKENDLPIGMCGLVVREELKYPDLGYAFLVEHCGRGYASEAAKTILEESMFSYSLNSVMAVTLPNNQRSNQLLNNLGFELAGTIELYGAVNNLYEYSK